MKVAPQPKNKKVKNPRKTQKKRNEPAVQQYGKHQRSCFGSVDRQKT